MAHPWTKNMFRNRGEIAYRRKCHIPRNWLSENGSHQGDRKIRPQLEVITRNGSPVNFDFPFACPTPPSTNSVPLPLQPPANPLVTAQPTMPRPSTGIKPTKPQDEKTKLREKNGANLNSNLPREKSAQETRQEAKENEGLTASSNKLWPQDVKKTPEGNTADIGKWSEPPHSEFQPQAEDTVQSRMTAISDPSPTGPIILPSVHPTLPPLHTPDNPLITVLPPASCQ